MKRQKQCGSLEASLPLAHQACCLLVPGPASAPAAAALQVFSKYCVFGRRDMSGINKQAVKEVGRGGEGAAGPGGLRTCYHVTDAYGRWLRSWVHPG